jgi:siroheme synthase
MRLARPGTSIAFYMAVEKAAQVQGDLMASGTPGASPVEIVGSVSTDAQKHVSTTLDRLAATVAEHGIESPAILMVRYPKSLAAAMADDGSVAA